MTISNLAFARVRLRLLIFPDDKLAYAYPLTITAGRSRFSLFKQADLSEANTPFFDSGLWSQILKACLIAARAVGKKLILHCQCIF